MWCPYQMYRFGFIILYTTATKTEPGTRRSHQVITKYLTKALMSFPTAGYGRGD